MESRTDALNRIVSLAQVHDLSADDIAAALTPKNETSSSTTGRILAWVGGVFILCGLGFFIESFWADMNAAARIILCLGTGMVMLVLALVFMRHPHYEKSTLPLFLLGALFQAGGILVAFDELGTGGDPQKAVLTMTVVMLIQSGLIFSKHGLTVHVFLMMVFGGASLGNLMDILGMAWEFEFTLTGVALLAAAFYLNRTAWNSIVPFWLLVGGVMTSYGVFDLLEDTPVHIVYIGYAGLMIYLSTLARSRTLLFVGTCAMIGYLGYFTGEYFADSLGWPLALIIIGIIFIALSVFAVKISKDYITGTP